MKESLIDIAVLLIFFCRPEKFEKVFEQVRLARPSKIYLYQDGPREGRQDDLEGIVKCRKIAENIDWNCDIHTFYQDKNVGCDPSEFIAQKWMFATEEMGIVLEDDDVPSQSFFQFCYELLHKYKDDERVHIICGMNTLGESKDCPYDYFFTQSGSIWGWASWKRVVDTWEEHYDFVTNKYACKHIMPYKEQQSYKRRILSEAKEMRLDGTAYYEMINGSNLYLNHRLNIVPRVNLISNIGIGKENTHSVSSMYLLPPRIRKIMRMQTYTLDFPLKHPPYMLEDLSFHKEIDKIFGRNWLDLFILKLQYKFYRIIATFRKLK